MARRSGFSLMEVLVVLTILTLLGSLVMPSVMATRASMRKTACGINIRSTGQLLAMYSASRGDALPFGPRLRQSFLLDSDNAAQNLAWGGSTGLRAGTWAFLFPEEWRGDRWNRAYQCPDQPAATFSGGGLWDLRVTPAYSLTEAVWLDERSLSARADVNKLSLRAHHAADVLFPSKKAYVLEFPTFCGVLRDEVPDLEIGQTHRSPAAMCFFDGSVRRYAVMDGEPGAAGTLPFLWTVDGVRGRDVR